MLFLIVYVGAIVVLFLFIIRRLELKIVNIIFQSVIPFQYILFCIYIYLILTIISSDFFDLKYFIDSHILVQSLNQAFTNFIESMYHLN